MRESASLGERPSVLCWAEGGGVEYFRSWLKSLQSSETERRNLGTLCRMTNSTSSLAHGALANEVRRSRSCRVTLETKSAPVPQAEAAFLLTSMRHFALKRKQVNQSSTWLDLKPTQKPLRGSRATTGHSTSCVLRARAKTPPRPLVQAGTLWNTQGGLQHRTTFSHRSGLRAAGTMDSFYRVVRKRTKI